MYTVKFTKIFVSGNLKGLSFDSSVSFASLDAASEYVAFLHNHVTVPVKSLDSADYTCHVVRIEPDVIGGSKREDVKAALDLVFGSKR